MDAIKKALEAALESLDAIGTPQEWDCRPLLHEALSELEARKVLTDEEIEQWWGNTHRTMGHMPRTDFEMVFILRSFAGSLPPKEQGPEPVTFSTHTQRVMNKWHAVIRIGNQSFTLAAYEGSQLEANCYADKAMEAFRRLVVPTAREKAMEEAGDAMRSACIMFTHRGPADMERRGLPPRATDTDIRRAMNVAMDQWDALRSTK